MDPITSIMSAARDITSIRSCCTFLDRFFMRPELGLKCSGLFRALEMLFACVSGSARPTALA